MTLAATRRQITKECDLPGKRFALSSLLAKMDFGSGFALEATVFVAAVPPNTGRVSLDRTAGRRLSTRGEWVVR
jgi:hypothetical protein